MINSRPLSCSNLFSTSKSLDLNEKKLIGIQLEISLKGGVDQVSGFSTIHLESSERKSLELKVSSMRRSKEFSPYLKSVFNFYTVQKEVLQGKLFSTFKIKNQSYFIYYLFEIQRFYQFTSERFISNLFNPKVDGLIHSLQVSRKFIIHASQYRFHKLVYLLYKMKKRLKVHLKLSSIQWELHSYRVLSRNYKVPSIRLALQTNALEEFYKFKRVDYGRRNFYFYLALLLK